ncbi:MAG: chorismate lyase [Zetaproteobacteria bacterium CG12_big_fil_rev_8_21_14_0_65_55_1124]|nr:MAG: hypothetical protein AUJ58_08105 [Zetaproteobacteria bacterium CG1_02_55_237]PIS18383.1 MAG: chorismate lyase [Zetaproteobacteria bacterium CG08_land_8_20_14_0_20_55_17]PIW42136.1 MAG: chorismate lyase [Zetaproteobacteria bacterium CG12_big_fil_rev_8_21_14_0_65_55_1124]PIY53233.1 MAG: chorismate lyase [Zetaproteobacteria bacterium CG_4_10_14_0_8_um_filter_55_43]PIZ38628.1 MAG: chorismate lyase [Zetaproteobacteria bacterium CG_4_10_14_0_2_um_filter_55_20]PJB82274.1 MAG: chorismate lyase
MFFGPLTSPHWEPVRHWSAAEHGVSSAVAGVLTVAGSLTRFLARHHQIHLDVQLHEQLVDKTTPEEAKTLNCTPGAPALRRNVSLLHRGTVMFDAESVLPLDTLPTDLMQDLQEGKKPLGNLLLDRGLSLSRSDLSVARFTEKGRFHGCWARRSVLRSDSGTRALVVEVFRSDMWKRIDTVTERRRT